MGTPPSSSGPPPPSDAPTGEAVIVVAHGSRAEGANAAHRELCASLEARTRRPVYAAFLELATPSIASAVDAAVTDGHRRLLVLPHFLAPGNHTTRDIPEAVAGSRTAHPGVTIRIAPHTGADPALVEMVAAAVERSAPPDV